MMNGYDCLGPLEQMDDFQVLQVPSGLKRFTVFCITVMLNFVAFLYSGVSPRSDVFTRNNIYSVHFSPHFLISDSSYYTSEYHRTAGRVRFSCAMMLFYSYYSAFATFVLF